MCLGVSVCLNGATAFWENCLHTVTCKNYRAQQWQDPRFPNRTLSKASHCLPRLAFPPLCKRTPCSSASLLGYRAVVVAVVVVVYNELFKVWQDLKNGGTHHSHHLSVFCPWMLNSSKLLIHFYMSAVVLSFLPRLYTHLHRHTYFKTIHCDSPLYSLLGWWTYWSDSQVPSARRELSFSCHKCRSKENGYYWHSTEK